jgi:hypothetical protein
VVWPHPKRIFCPIRMFRKAAILSIPGYTDICMQFGQQLTRIPKQHQRLRYHLCPRSAVQTAGRQIKIRMGPIFTLVTTCHVRCILASPVGALHRALPQTHLSDSSVTVSPNKVLGYQEFCFLTSSFCHPCLLLRWITMSPIRKHFSRYLYLHLHSC